MNQSQVTKAFEKIAMRKGISVTEVRKEIQKSIDEEMKSDDPKIQAYWNRMNYKGEKPTPEEVVLYIAKQAKSI